MPRSILPWSYSSAEFYHGRIVVRMRDRDRLDPAHGVDHFDRRAIDERDAVPQDVALRRAQEHRALADAEVRERQKRDQAGLELVNCIHVAAGQRLDRRPTLPRWRNILTLVQADRT